MQASSSIPATASMFLMLWIHGTCLSPMPSMRWAPYPLQEQGRALQGLGCHHLESRVDFAEVLGTTQRPGRSLGQTHPGKTGGRAAVGLEDLLHGPAGAHIVPRGVAELRKLVEDHDLVAAFGLELFDLVVDLLDVRLRPRRREDLGADLLQPLEALARHALRQHSDGGTCQQRGVVGAAAAVVAGGRPQSFLRGRIERPAHELLNQRPEGRPHFVGAGGEELSHQHEDARLDPGQLARQFDEVDAAETAAGRHRLVLPGDAEEVARVEVPEADPAEFSPDAGRNDAGVRHLAVGGDDDVALATAADGVFEDLFGASHGYSVLSPVRFRTDRTIVHVGRHAGGEE